jgi:putative transposase
LTGARVVATVELTEKRSDYPNMITVENDSEFASKSPDAWAYEHGIKLDFIRPGKPVKNAVIESSGGPTSDKLSTAE